MGLNPTCAAITNMSILVAQFFLDVPAVHQPSNYLALLFCLS